ncbi:glucose-6-phosphate isomerase [Nocardia sp. NPDC006630]|uniref:glucose-6-phosphate isomerase n=1 Tax=Nocardia sp. NPDC006630 TaxID=3157181 RepID=UPI0033B47530
MTEHIGSWWERYCALRFADPISGVSVDVSGAGFPVDYLHVMADPLSRAFEAMTALERGAIANPDEDRYVGHYWLRTPNLAPSHAITAAITDSLARLDHFADRVRTGELHGAGGRFRNLLHVGIGGSATGPDMLREAWSAGSEGLTVQVLDNADPDGVDRALRNLDGGVGQTLVSVVSKSGITPTPRQVLRELERAYTAADLAFHAHAVATTVLGSELADQAAADRWLEIFPMWDWVGGRYSVTSMVGLLPAALLGARTGEFLAGAARMDACTRTAVVLDNPAALLALAWFWLGGGTGDRNMVVLPYRDELAGVTRWIQQLIMESLGKRADRASRTVQQGLTVYGHKGVSDQHSYLQQLREGRDDAFVTFIGTHRARRAHPESAHTLDGHLFGGLVGTMSALRGCGRPTIVIMLPDAGEDALGALVALYERAVGLYAELIDVNAYHQPGVDKHTAVTILELQHALLECLAAATEPMTAPALADKAGLTDRADIAHRLLEHLAITRVDLVGVQAGSSLADTVFFAPNRFAHGT